MKKSTLESDIESIFAIRRSILRHAFTRDEETKKELLDIARQLNSIANKLQSFTKELI